MTPQSPNVRSIFARAAELDTPAERLAYLDEACAGAPDARARVEALLRAHDGAGDFLHVPPAAPSETASYEPSTDTPGALVGPYKLLEKIGEGGMGEVWVADQLEPIKRRIALKLIKPGMDSRSVLGRFEAERQALAVMDHPNIAKVLDAGTTPDGRPYFVMELVKGTPITEFCDIRKLTPKERLELFVPVCQAIQHAHMKGIIHRDIKPSNVLVELHDDRAVVKVIDFGVAKAVGQQLTEKTIYTGFGALVGTPAYMAPEQATFNALDVDTRADVYALGVLLYELLAGSPPIEKERLKLAALDEVLRIVRDEEPPRPSQRLSTSQTKASIAATRGAEPDKLSALMKGEIDWIVMKALEKDRTRRYESANGFAADVQRYLSGEQVQAVPPSLGYRLQKAYRRNRAAVRVASAFVCLMVGAVVMGAVLAVRATEAERDTTAALDDALTIRKRLDVRLVELGAANEKISRDQQTMRTNQYAWDMQTLPITWEAGNIIEARRLLERQVLALRGFEWNYWNRQVNAELVSAILELPPSDTELVRLGRSWVFSGDGRRVAMVQGTTSIGAARSNIQVRVWDTQTWKEIQSYSTPGRINGLSDDRDSRTFMSQDGKRLLVFAEYVRTLANRANDPFAVLRVLDVDSGNELFDSRKVPDVKTATFATLSPNGSKLFVQFPSDPSKQTTPQNIQAWDLDHGGKQLFKIENASFHRCSPDGKRIIGIQEDAKAAGNRRLSTVWDAETGKAISSWERGQIIGYNPDGSLLVGSTMVGEGVEGKPVLKLIDTKTGEELPSIPLPISLRIPGRTKPVQFQSANLTGVFSPDGSRLALFPGMGTEDPNAYFKVLVYDLPNRRQLFTLDDPNVTVWRGPILGSLRGGRTRPIANYGPYFTPDGRQFVCRNDNIIHTFDATSGKPLQKLRGHVNWVSASAITPAGRLISLEFDGTFKEWDITPAGPVLIRPGVTTTSFGASGSVGFAANGAWLAVAGRTPNKEQVVIWDVTGKESKRIVVGTNPQASGPMRYVAPLSSDGKRIALLRQSRPAFDPFVGNAKPGKPVLGELTVRDVASEQVLFRAELPFDGRRAVIPLAFSPDGGSVGALLHEKSDTSLSIRVTDIDGARTPRSIPLPGDVTVVHALCFRPDGKRLAGTTTSSSLAGPALFKLRVWDAAEGREVYAVDIGQDNNPTVAWSLDGSRLALAGKSGITLFDAATGAPKVALNLADCGGTIAREVTPVFSNDGRRIACTVQIRTRAEVVRVWDTDSGKEMLTVWTGTSEASGSLSLRSLAFTSDGHRLLQLIVDGRGMSFEPDTKGARDTITVRTWDATPQTATGPLK